MKTKIKRILLFLQRENLHRLLLILVVLIFLSTLGLALFERKSLIEAVWWSVVTITTVGYGDITPQSLGGRIIGALIMFFGIGILGLFTATIASIFVEKKMKEERGMRSYDFENHIILCEWNYRAREILHELRMDHRIETAPIILIAEIDVKPVDDKNLFFIQGSITEENLKRANLEKAKTVVILGDDQLEANARDAKAVLITLTVESLNPNVYTIVELVDGTNVQHCERANADEIIVGSEFSSKLISRATLDHGISKVLSELLSSRFGNDLFKIPVPQSMQGKSFIEIFTEMKQSNQSIILAVQKGNEGEVISNPPVDYKVAAGDYLIVISEGKPQSLL
ncbi:MAG: potassium channel family protein [bacterium]